MKSLLLATLCLNSLHLLHASELRFETEDHPEEVPGPFIYDPVSGESRPNRSSGKFSGTSLDLSTSLDSSSSFTIEAFAKPSPELASRPRDFLAVFRSAEAPARFKTGILRSTPPHSYNWWHTRIELPSAPRIDLAKNSYKGISMVQNDTPWRHLALSWNHTTRELSYYLDYRLQASLVLDTTPDWNVASLEVGGSPDTPFQGWIDEVRATPTVLQPWDFQRASQVALTNVSFRTEAEPGLPADYGHVDVRLHYGAVGDGIHDDTQAIQKAFAENENRVPNAYETVYFPEGTYLISDSIRFSRFMVVRGAGADKTRIQLKDNAPGYADPNVPKPAFAVGYDWPYIDRPAKNRAGNVIGNYLFDFSIDTGKGNPAALGLDFHCNNVGSVENVNISSGDGSGLVGLDLRRPWPGPCLVKNVSIQGFDTGIAAAHREYSLVFSDIRLRDQREVAISNKGNVLSMEQVISENAVPAIANEGGGLVVLINSQLRGGASDQTAISSRNASLYLRNVTFDGYAKGVVEIRQPKDQPEEILYEQAASTRVDEYFTGPFQSAFEGTPTGSLKLEIKPTPAIPRPPLSEWVNVLDFEDRVEEGDWAPAIQAAVDRGKALVYFPAGPRYEIHRDVQLRGAIQTFLGGSPKTRIGNGHDENPELGAALVLTEELPHFQSEMLTLGHVKHDVPVPLVFRHGAAEQVSAGPNCGDLFIEDAGGKFRFGPHQRVWARQLNPETKGVPEIINNGAQLWILGMKTEYLSTKIENRSSARTEVLGGLMYPVHPVLDETLPMFLNEDSDISLIHGVSVYKKNHKIYIRDTQAGQTVDFTTWDWVAGRPITNLYRSSRP